MDKLAPLFLVALLFSTVIQAEEEPVLLDEEEAVPAPEQAEELPPKPPEPEEPLLERGREILGDGYIDLTQTIDGFLAGKRLDREYNESYLTLITQGTWFERSDNQADVKLKGKLDLPHTERRFKLFIDSDPDFENSIEDRNRSISRGDRIREGSSVAGFEFAKDRPLTHWKTSYSLGARNQDGIKVLVRARVRKHWVLSDKWTSYFHQDVWHLDGTGWGETSRSEFTRSLTENSWLQFLTEVEYQDDDPAWQYIHSWRVDHILSQKHALTYRIGVLGETPEGIFQDNRFLSFTWRSLIYQDWMFLHLTPEVYFAREDNYNSEAAFTAKLEIFLTD